MFVFTAFLLGIMVFSFDLTAFYLGWFSGALFFGFFLPHEYREPARDIHDAMIKKGLSKEQARLPYEIRRSIKIYFVASAGVSLGLWFFLEVLEAFYNKDVSQWGLLFALFAIFWALPAGADAFRLDALEEKWLEEGGEDDGDFDSSSATSTTEKNKDNYSKDHDDKDKQKSLGRVGEVRDVKRLPENKEEGNGEDHDDKKSK
jgi:hypothetical protein